jgi:hypothetical protein
LPIANVVSGYSKTISRLLAFACSLKKHDVNLPLSLLVARGRCGVVVVVVEVAEGGEEDTLLDLCLLKVLLLEHLIVSVLPWTCTCWRCTPACPCVD